VNPPWRRSSSATAPARFSISSLGTFCSFKPKAVRVKDVPESALWVHDAHDVGAALVLANMPSPAFPIPVGVFVDVEAPVYEEILLEQEQRVLSQRGPGDIAKLLSSGDTWKIG